MHFNEYLIVKMELNSLIFPAPSIKYTSDELEGDIMYVPRHFWFNRVHRSLVNAYDSSK